MTDQTGTNTTDHDRKAWLAEHSNSLAEERTRLARERTVLAHTRTGFSAFLFGVALLGLFSGLPHLLGYGFLIVGSGFVLSGSLSYVRSSRRTAKIIARTEHRLRHRGQKSEEETY